MKKQPLFIRTGCVIAIISLVCSLSACGKSDIPSTTTASSAVTSSVTTSTSVASSASSATTSTSQSISESQSASTSESVSVSQSTPPTVVDDGNTLYYNFAQLTTREKPDYLFDFLTAFFTKDTQTLYDKYFYPVGSLEKLNTVVFNEDSIVVTFDKNTYTGVSTFEVTESSLDTLPKGYYSYEFSDGPSGLSRGNNVHAQAEPKFTPMVDTLQQFAPFANYISDEGLFLTQCDKDRNGDAVSAQRTENAVNCAVIYLVLTDDDWNLTQQEVTEQAQTRLGLQDIDLSLIDPMFIDPNGNYYMPAMGGAWRIYDITNEVTHGDTTDITVQFYVDEYRLCASHNITYTVQKDANGKLMFLSCTINSTTPYAPGRGAM